MATIRWSDNNGNEHVGSILDVLQLSGINQQFVIQWSVAQGTPAVIANDVAPWYVLPCNLLLTQCMICAKTLPTGNGDLAYDVKYKRGSDDFASIFGITNPLIIDPGGPAVMQTPVNGQIIAAGAFPLQISDILRVDCLVIGDSVAGQDVTIQLVGYLVN